MRLYYKEQQKRDYHWFLFILQAKERGRSTRSPAGTSARGPVLAKIEDVNKYLESNTYSTPIQYPAIKVSLFMRANMGDGVQPEEQFCTQRSRKGSPVLYDPV